MQPAKKPMYRILGRQMAQACVAQVKCTAQEHVLIRCCHPVYSQVKTQFADATWNVERNHTCTRTLTYPYRLKATLMAATEVSGSGSSPASRVIKLEENKAVTWVGLS
jgi:hypothetical protein